MIRIAARSPPHVLLPPKQDSMGSCSRSWESTKVATWFTRQMAWDIGLSLSETLWGMPTACGTRRGKDGKSLSEVLRITSLFGNALLGRETGTVTLATMTMETKFPCLSTE